MLIVVEDGYLKLRLEALLDLKTPRGGDVLQVYAAKGRGYAFDSLHNLFCVLGVEADGESVNVRELFEEHRLALHYRHRRPRAYIAQAQHRCTVGDDSYHVTPARQVKGP